MKFFCRQELPTTVAEASLASLQSSIAALRARRIDLTYEINIREGELAEVSAQLNALEPALAEIVADPLEIELDMKELTHDE
jgi:hypothetical protein